MGAFLDKPKTEKHVEIGGGNGLRFGLSSMQGWRIEMEDAHTAVTELPGKLKSWSFFGVYDGHAGARVSELCSKDLLNAILNTAAFKKLADNPNGLPDMKTLIQTGIREGFLQLDSQIRQLPEVESGEDKSGSTAVCAFVTPKYIVFANCGDSRAILIRDKQVQMATSDHKPINPGEKERITNAGGTVMIQRVNGSLAVSRSLGDFDYKRVEGKGPTEQLVSPEPEVTIVERDPKRDQCIVLACDGIWDVLSNDELAEYVLQRFNCVDDIPTMCNELIDTCLYKGSRDNMSVICIALEAAPQIDPAVREKDVSLDESIRRLVKDFLATATTNVEVNTLLQHIQGFQLQNYPPGGISTKRHMIDPVFDAFIQANSQEQPSGAQEISLEDPASSDSSSNNAKNSCMTDPSRSKDNNYSSCSAEQT